MLLAKNIKLYLLLSLAASLIVPLVTSSRVSAARFLATCSDATVFTIEIEADNREEAMAEAFSRCPNGGVQSVEPVSSAASTLQADCEPTPAGAPLTRANCKIIDYLFIFINLLSGLVGVVVVGMIILGGIQYSSAGDDPQKISAAKKRIFNAVFALAAFIFMFAFLQWIVPGGIF